MSPHEKAHSNDFHGHFPSVDNQEDQIDDSHILCYNVYFLIERQEQAVEEDDKEDKAIKPWID